MQNLGSYFWLFLYCVLFFIAFSLGNKIEMRENYSRILSEISEIKMNLNESRNGESTKTVINQSLNNNFPYLGNFKISMVVDGDTVHVVGEQGEKDIVRMMAVNTAEKNASDLTEKCFAFKQTEFTKNNIGGKNMYLFGDKGQPKRDKYNRILAYLSTTTDLRYSFNELLVDTGNSRLYKATPPAIKYKEFEKKMEIAKLNKLGIWSGLCN